MITPNIEIEIPEKCTRYISNMVLHFVYEDGRERLIPEAEFEAMMKAYLGKYGHHDLPTI